MEDINDADGPMEADGRRVFPAGCTITNIRNGIGGRNGIVYANLRGPDGELIISSTLSYISEQLTRARICVA